MRRKGARLVAWGMAGLLSPTSLAASDVQLVEAARAGDTAAVRALLEANLDVNTPWPDGATALHWVVNWDDVETAALLITAGARVDATNDYGVTPLSLAATNGSAAMIELLLTAGADPGTALPSGETALMTAARTGKVDAVEALLAHGASVSAKDPAKGQTALMWAVSDNHVEVARLLLAHGADVQAGSSTGFTPIMFAARQGNVDMTRMLLAAGANVDDTDSTGASVLLVATVRGHAPLAEFLLDHGADPRAGAAGYTPLHWAATKVELNEFPTGYGPWHEWGVLGGVVTGRRELLGALLAHGADPNARTTKAPPQFSQEGGVYVGLGATPFVMAAAHGDVTTMRLLSAHGADPFLKTDTGSTALIAAVGRPSGAAQDPTPQDAALEAVKLAVTLGLDVNAADDSGESALHTAAYLGYETILQFLVEHGAQVNHKNERGETPLRIALGIERGALKFPGHPHAAALLRELGGTVE